MDFELNYKNTTINYRVSGKGPAVVLLHGFLENLTMWNAVSDTLSKQNKVIAIDLLGHGKSENLGYIHTMETQAEMVKAVLNHLRLRKYILVGHSMGGYICLAFAELFPTTVKGLCLMNSTAKPDSKEKKTNRDRAIEAVKQNHKMFIRMSIPNLFSENNRAAYKKEIDAVINEALSCSVQGIVASLEGMKIRKNRLPLFKSSTFKKLMIVGKKDPVLDAESLKSQLKNSDVNVIELPDGHMSYIENTTETIETLKQFIKSCNNR